MKKTITNHIASSLYSIAVILTLMAVIEPQQVHAQDRTNFWKYQCIDTMKESRDNARASLDDPTLDKNIVWEMKTIKSLGANCVAIDTPYDAEFLPVLNKWVAGARAEDLHIWFRGNFSGWEGWFGYPKITSSQDELTRLSTFIKANPQVFQDGDIFTGTPEAENGGPLVPVNPAHYPDYRQFLIDEYATEKDAFSSINKNITLNWFSMNGDIAKQIYDQVTLDKIGNVVTVDHYIKDANEMGDIIKYFNTTYGSKFMLGEFGAPIPDINGNMTEDQQATFVDQVFQQLYQQREKVLGINYWDLTDGSTALMNDDKTPRKVTEVIKKYFNPPVVKGKVTTIDHFPLADLDISTNDSSIMVKTDKDGMYSFPTTATDIELQVNYQDKVATASVSHLQPDKTYIKNFMIGTMQKSLVEQLQEFIKKCLQ
ncbi:MAG: hypothetical protein ACR2LN_02745 [Candidatus Levyibacteriota bacterium]